MTCKARSNARAKMLGVWSKVPTGQFPLKAADEHMRYLPHKRQIIHQHPPQGGFVVDFKVAGGDLLEGPGTCNTIYLQGFSQNTIVIH